MKPKICIETLFADSKSHNSYLKVCAPMVRYSRIQFRALVRLYGVDMCFTPMIMADSFCQSAKARSNEFSTSYQDAPLIVQFAAKSTNDIVGASKLILPYADGVDLNCGCPQKWAIKDGYGCALLENPEIIHALVRELKNSLPSSFSVSVKIRLLKHFQDTIRLCQQLEKCGVTFLTVHGRTASQKSSEAIDITSLSEVIKSVTIPVVANGGVKNLEDANRLYQESQCSGVMAANGILSNPALFAGYNVTPLSAVEHWVSMCNTDKITFQCYHHHLVFMLEKILSKTQKKVFNHLKSFDEVNDYLFENFELEPKTFEEREIQCYYNDELLNMYNRKCSVCFKQCCVCDSRYTYDTNKSDGKYFTSVVQEYESEFGFIDSNLFNDA